MQAQVGVDRQIKIYRAIAKDKLRDKGITLSPELFRGLSTEIKGLNERHKIDPPITLEEFLYLYKELAQELIEEHLQNVQCKIVGEVMKRTEAATKK